MQTRSSIIKQLAVVAAFCIVAIAGHFDALAQVGPTQKYRVQFGWLFDAHHVGFITAKRNNYYAAEGLDVDLLPGGLDTSPVRSLVAGGADIAQISGSEQLIASRSEQLPIVAIAAFHRKSPHAIISTERRPIRSAEDLRGAKVAVVFGDAAELYFNEFVNKAGIKRSEFQVLPFRFDLTPLLRGEVDAITGFSTDQPFTLEAKGIKPVVLPYFESGQLGYGYIFVTTKRTDSTQQEQLARFLRASRKGWNEAFRDPNAAIEILKKELPNIDTGVELKKLNALRAIMLDDDGRLASWKMDSDVLNASFARAVVQEPSRKQPDLSGLFDNAPTEQAERR